MMHMALRRDPNITGFEIVKQWDRDRANKEVKEVVGTRAPWEGRRNRKPHLD